MVKYAARQIMKAVLPCSLENKLSLPPGRSYIAFLIGCQHTVTLVYICFPIGNVGQAAKIFELERSFYSLISDNLVQLLYNIFALLISHCRL